MKRNNLFRIIYIFTSVSIFIIFFYCVISYPNSLGESEVIEVDDVIVKCNNEKEQKVDLNKYVLPTSNIGDKYEIKYTIPNVDIDNPCLLADLYHSMIEVWIDQEKIYEYGQDLYKKDIPLGHEYFCVSLPQEISNKQLTIKITFSENDSLTSIPTIKITNERSSYLNLVQENFLVLFVSVGLILFGVIGSIFSVTRKSFGKEYSNITLISFFCIDVSIWMLTSSKLSNILIDNFRIVSFLEYFSLYAAPTIVLIYFSKMQSNKKHSILLKRFALVCGIALAMTLGAYIIFNYHYSNILSFFHLLILIGLILVIYCSISSFSKKKKSEKALIYGMMFIGVVIFIDILRFNIDKYIAPNLYFGVSLMPIGTLCFIFGMLYSYGVELVESYYGRTERKILEKLAYNDTLTGIYNRRKCEEILSQISDSEEEVTIISFDINRLKYVNDNLGHQVGDDMIINFSKYLLDSFKDIGYVGRMGGDEFIAIIKDNDEIKIQEAIDRLNKSLEIYNERKDNQYYLSTSIGYAMRKNKEDISVWKLYEIADKKMYDSKMKYYKEKNIRRV